MVMKRQWSVIVTVLAGCTVAIAALDHSKRGGAADRDQTGTDRYEQRQPSRDGIGKMYLGREIAHVMGHQGFRWLERDSRIEEEQPDRMIEALGLEADDVVADVGAGSGYISFRIAAKVSKGRVLAVDIQPQMIALLDQRIVDDQVTNVETILSTIEDARLPVGVIDLAIMVDAYHEFSHPYEMLESIVASLAPGGRVVLIEYRAEDPEVPIKRLHKLSERQAKKEMKAVGLRLLQNIDVLPWQHILVFGTKPVVAEP